MMKKWHAEQTDGGNKLNFDYDNTWLLKSDSQFLKKNCVVCFIESPLKMTKYAFYFILKALYVLKISRFLSWLFGHVEKL